jgi:hypothetical protein
MWAMLGHRIWRIRGRFSMKTYRNYIIASIILVPAIIASFLSYTIVIDQSMIQEQLDAVVPMTGAYMTVPYEIDQVTVEITDTVIVDIHGNISLKQGVQFDVQASGDIMFSGSTFYLTNFKLGEIDYQFNSLEDEAMVKGGLQAGSNWFKSKIAKGDMDSKYKETILSKVNSMQNNPDKMIKTVVQKMRHIPLYNMDNGPFIVRTLGAFVTDVTISDGYVTIEYSPRIMWVWLISALIAMGLVLGIGM